MPLAAQLACTPLVAAISGPGQPGRGRREPAGGPGRRPGDGSRAGGRSRGPRLPTRWDGSWPRPAAWCAGWIIAVAVRGADLPVAAFGWPAGPVGIATLTLICAALSLFLGALLARRATTLGLGGLMVCALLVPLPTPGWPAEGVGDGRLRRRPGRRPGAQRRPRHRRGGGRGSGPGADGPVPATGWVSSGFRSLC